MYDMGSFGIFISQTEHDSRILDSNTDPVVGKSEQTRKNKLEGWKKQA